jgi:quercetin dioxygenase-like cupin family protein
MPELITLQTGASNKVLQVTGQAGISMPLHYSTREAVVIVLEGSAILIIDNKENLLEKGTAFIIPARQKHSLTLKTEFKALVIMAHDSVIEFVN